MRQPGSEVGSEQDVTASSFLREAWRALGGDADLPAFVDVHGDPGLPSRLAVADLALGAVAAQRLAAAELAALPGRPVGPVSVDAAHVGVSFRSERFLRVDGRPQAVGFAPLSRFLPTADGWVRLHANYPHHHAAVLRALGPDPAAAVAERTGADVEESVVAAGGVAAEVRTTGQWRVHPQGASVAGGPVVRLARVGDAAVRMRPFPGLRVLDLTRVIAGPVGTRTLASYGADVLRIDRPSLQEDRNTLLETGSGKRHTALDLADRSDRRRFDELLHAADVLVHGYRPGALARHGLSEGELAQRHPDLVVVGISAWGEHGPWGRRRGFDSIVQAASGIADAVRGDDGVPGALPAQALDHGAGHLLAATVLRALTSARTDGGVWHGQVSLARLAHWLLEAPLPDAVAPVGDADPAPYLVDLPSPYGVLTVVRPPGSPTWTHGPVPVPPERVAWRSDR